MKKEIFLCEKPILTSYRRIPMDYYRLNHRIYRRWYMVDLSPSRKKNLYINNKNASRYPDRISFNAINIRKSYVKELNFFEN